MNMIELKVFNEVKLRNLQRKYKRLKPDSEEAVKVFDEIQMLKEKLKS